MIISLDERVKKGEYKTKIQTHNYISTDFTGVLMTGKTKKATAWAVLKNGKFHNPYGYSASYFNGRKSYHLDGQGVSYT